jgi:error-prone DNA polymerase
VADHYTAELHLHTCYSFLEGASQPEELVERAAQLGYQALAITDHDGLHGAMAFAQACAAAGIRPITGVELSLASGLVLTGPPVHLTLLVESERGYANLCRLVTLAHSQTRTSPREPTPPALHPDHLVGRTAGLIALSGCRSGEPSRLVDADRLDDAREALRRLAELFGRDSTFVELQHNLVQGDSRRVARLARLAAELDLPVVATGNVHYHERARHRLQDALVAIRHRATLESSHRQRRANSEFFLRRPGEVEALFADLPEAIANVERVSRRCRGFDLADHRDLGYDFPDFTRKDGEQGSSADDVLAAYCWQKFELRYAGEESGLVEQARRQLADELALVAKHHLAGFFLIYRDLQELATEVALEVRGAGTVRGGSGLPPGRGRGSSVSSIICYLIGLSHVDPVRNRLFFRRFLNEDLQAVPDIDLDFARDIREQLILRVYERYGRDHAALVCSFATYHLRSAVRDLGKVLGLPPAAIDKLAKLAEGGRASSVRAELASMPELQSQAAGPLWDHLVDLAAQIDGFPRHVGQHVGGMIISSRPVVELVPVQPAAMAGRFICQWDKDSCDDARFIKIDFLALGMLSLVEECLELIWQSRGKKVDLGGIDYGDAAVYDAICRGDTVGTFQIESRAQIQMLTRTQPRTLDDLAVQVAIVRPGPIVGGAVNPYVQRRELLRQDPTYRAPADHPLLDELLRDTLGVVLYQDQVLEVAMAMGGFTPGQADQFRRSMSRRRSRAAMEKFRDRFLLGARRNGVEPAAAAAMFDKLCGFSEFGFPKSHAYAFAVLAYQSAWLRHHYPAEFYAALLNNQPMGFYAPHVLVGDARRHGLKVLRVAINRSGVGCVPKAAASGPADQGYLLLGLATVRGIGRELAEAIVAEREAHGPYRTLADLLRRTGLPRAAAERLIAVGALAEFGLARRELLWQLGLLLPRAEAGQQPSLGLPVDQDMVALPEMTNWERMVADYGLLGLSPSYHPLGLLRPELPADVLTAAQVRAAPDGARVRTAGLVVCRQRPGTAKGFVFLLLEDETGLTNVVVRPDLYERRRGLIRGQPYLCVEGRVQLHSGSLNLLALAVEPVVAEARLPRAEVRHAHPGDPHDPREAAARAELLAATPNSHDFR